MKFLNFKMIHFQTLNTMIRNTLVFNDIQLSLEVDNKVGIGGDKWPAADQFCLLLSDNKWREFFSNIFDNKRIIELGSGTGLVGVLIDKLYNPQEIAITDIPSYVELIQRNITINNCSKSIAMSFDWNNRPESNKYDIILASECVYNEELYQPLIDSFLQLSNKQTIIFIGITRLYSKKTFFKLLKDSNFKYTLIPKEVLAWDENNYSDVRVLVVHQK